MFGVRGAGGGRGAVAAGCVVAALVALTGCGGGGDDGKGEAGKAPAPSRPAVSSGALTESQLSAVAFRDGERAGDLTASEYALDGPLGDAYTAAPAVCQPLVSLAGDVSGLPPAAQVQRKADKPEEMLGVTVDVTLRSYAADGAAKVMKALDQAGRECAGGFTEERAVARARYEKAEPAALPGFADEADEAKAYRFTVLDVKGKLKLYEYLTVLRSGSTTLAFRGEILGTQDIGGVPEDVMAAQWRKFRAGQA
ncbi:MULTISPECIES: hypothetical protein [Streptomyces]|uniref:Lipoprotein n=1 Tax=Streptomyces glycanivorans TaxID=3033808 RepID=A0ABY9JCX0_9ACTN|nr:MULTISPECIES: hypothetical protein [unclassified Streptomyces]WSQ77229.1 hypothetical protein OG725_09005 [Streptomyces sp. NBC_01213]WLQ63841.1 hypothetical protein P8A20_09645 [Streptomyces sp. Alt3]WSQ84560.1 hypothetical protein OG722_09445 [Streptomyces sp. NBC_01212]WSR09327.1 hypothetical protein OG265_26430 [Streptomyces sp. NBC_01208]WSR47945.1 hypothetical protein OG279_10050 [Streptomyces sp. NBC_01201]